MKVNGNAIVERIDELLAFRKEKRAFLCKAIGINPGAVTNWCGKKQSLPRADVALAIADYFGVSLRWLLTGVDETEISTDERNLLVNYNRLTDENQRNVRALIDSMISVTTEGEKGKKEAVG
jgi:transcriptional regulator with XRE-family HTH domain